MMLPLYSAQKRLKHCEEKLETIQKLAMRYHDLYLQEKSDQNGNSLKKGGCVRSTTDRTGSKPEKHEARIKRPDTVAGHEKSGHDSQPR